MTRPLQKAGIAFIAFSICASGLMAQEREGSRSQSARSQRSDTQQGGTARQATPDAISKNPQAYYGKKVRVTAPVEEVFGRNLVALAADRIEVGPDLLVVIPRANALLPEESRLTVTGTVRPYNRQQFERDYDWFDARWFESEGETVNYDQKPIIIAESVYSKAGREYVPSAVERRGSGSRESAMNRNSASDRSQREMQQRQEQQRERRQETASTQRQQKTRALVVSAGDIAADPERFYGKRVQVRAEVEDVHGKGVFTLDEDRLFAGPDVLVIAPGGSSSPRDGQMAVVTGTVREFASQDVYQDYDWYGYGWYGYHWGYYDNVWNEWEDRPAIIADSIRTESGRELVMQKTSDKPTRQNRSQKIFVASPGDITESPQDYTGTVVSVQSAVGESLNPHLFVLEEQRVLDASDLLVLVPRPAGNAPEGKQVTVIGSVRPFVLSNFERDYDWFDASLFESDEQMAEWEETHRPVIVARSVRTQAGDELVQNPSAQRQEAVGGSQQ